MSLSSRQAAARETKMREHRVGGWERVWTLLAEPVSDTSTVRSPIELPVLSMNVAFVAPAHSVTDDGLARPPALPVQRVWGGERDRSQLDQDSSGRPFLSFSQGHNDTHTCTQRHTSDRKSHVQHVSTRHTGRQSHDHWHTVRHSHCRWQPERDCAAGRDRHSLHDRHDRVRQTRHSESQRRRASCSLKRRRGQSKSIQCVHNKEIHKTSISPCSLTCAHLSRRRSGQSCLCPRLARSPRTRRPHLRRWSSRSP